MIWISWCTNPMWFHWDLVSSLSTSPKSTENASHLVGVRWLHGDPRNDRSMCGLLGWRIHWIPCQSYLASENLGKVRQKCPSFQNLIYRSDNEAGWSHSNPESPVSPLQQTTSYQNTVICGWYILYIYIHIYIYIHTYHIIIIIIMVDNWLMMMVDD